MMMSKKAAASKKKQVTQVKIIKEQVKKLIMLKKLKISNSIKILRNKKRFDIQKMMNLMISLSIKQLLNESQQLRKKFAWNLQSFISRYRVKRITITQKKTVFIEKTMSNVMLRAFRITTETWTNDEKITSIFIIIWIENVQISWSLVDNESVIEMISKRLVTKLSQLKIKHDENLSMTLITDHRITLKNYVWISINCRKMKVRMKIYVYSIIVYDLLLELRWQKRVQMKIDMRKETLSIIDIDERKRMI